MNPSAIPRATRRLQAARLVGATTLAVLGERVVDGTPGTASFLAHALPLGLTLGGLYSLVMALCTAACVAGLLGARRWAGVVFPLLLSLHIGVFVPVLASDASTAMAVILWCLLLLGDTLFSLSMRGVRVRREHPTRSEPAAETGPWISRYGDAARHLTMVAVLATTAVGGFRLTGSLTAHVVCLVFDLGVILGTAPLVFLALRQRRRYLVALVVLLALGLPSALTGVTALLGLCDVYLAGVLVLMLARSKVIAEALQSFYTRPALLILSTFGALAGVGALLLTFPGASTGPQGVPFIDALFTAMSATCVTGLIVLDTPNAFSPLGHVIILMLIQLGGLGIMVLSTFATVMLGGRLGLRGEQALEEMLDLQSPGSAYELTRFIVVSTLLIEAFGAALLCLGFHYGHDLAWGDALWRGTFHAISAFCNAGFSLWTDSLMPFQRDTFVTAVHAALIVLGGLGFTVLAALWLQARGQQRRQSLQTRVVLWMSGGLIVGGTLLFAATEWNGALAGFSTWDKWLNAAFQSVTLRTAGFNSVDFTTLERSTILMMIVWMFVGASPGSTGGGIKTTTLAVMLAAIPALIRNQPRAMLLRRIIPHDIVYRAATIMTVATMVAVLVTFLLLATHERLSFEKVAFEAVSALATVGLSIGATGELNAAGKWLIIGTMFIGRVGPISLALALGTPRNSHISFPEAKVMVG
ncbi:MAG: hypothetical protein JNL82_13355 [Myxococcales bacterium]|nr:hypothetical protein [Myxococcales bacterium]